MSHNTTMFTNVLQIVNICVVMKKVSLMEKWFIRCFSRIINKPLLYFSIAIFHLNISNISLNMVMMGSMREVLHECWWNIYDFGLWITCYYDPQIFLMWLLCYPILRMVLDVFFYIVMFMRFWSWWWWHHSWCCEMVTVACVSWFISTHDVMQ